MNIVLNRADLSAAINDYIRKRGVNAKVTQVTYFSREEDWVDVAQAAILFDKEGDEE
ncbi:hypothetical protein [Bacillus atrophaeus]|uniref:hypothetical protein n=1 Tax=Bacillus atrophaeus TaxID=1452 RepID=UPI002E23E298|nr:hypothetical protein [Bacillus atrophaeus]